MLSAHACVTKPVHVLVLPFWKFLSTTNFQVVNILLLTWGNRIYSFKPLCNLLSMIQTDSLFAQPWNTVKVVESHTAIKCMYGRRQVYVANTTSVYLNIWQLSISSLVRTYIYHLSPGCSLLWICVFSIKHSCLCGGTVASWLAHLTPDRAVRVRDLAGDIALCSWTRHLTLTVPLFTQVYKWVPANLMPRVTLRWTSIPSRGE